MRQPGRRNAAIDNRRLRRWATDFSGYRHAVSEDRIRDWIAQFQDGDRDIAARLLDCVDFFSHDQIAGAFRTILNGLEGWNSAPPKRVGKWRFVPYSASAGESGDSMLHKFRHANNLAGNQYNELFISRSDLLREGLGADDTVVLIDDFVGSGDQACDSWNRIFGELLAEVGRVYLVVVAGRIAAIERVALETGLEVVPAYHFADSDNVFDGRCKNFNSSERTALLKYCKRANRREPKGKGDCGLLVVFAHTCPNNSLPILHVVNQQWEGLFRRYN